MLVKPKNETIFFYQLEGSTSVRCVLSTAIGGVMVVCNGHILSPYPFFLFWPVGGYCGGGCIHFVYRVSNHLVQNKKTL